MDLNIRQSFVNRLFRGTVFSLDPPNMTVNGQTKYNFYLVLVAMSEALHSWTEEKVLRDRRGSRSGEWCIWTESKRHVLSLKRVGRRLHIVVVTFQGNVETFLESVEDRIDIDNALSEYSEAIERRGTRRIEIPQEILESAQTFVGKHVSVGSNPRLTPPPPPLKPVRIPIPKH